MSFIADPSKEYHLWDFITGDFYKGMAIASDRYQHLYELNNLYPLKITLHDPTTDYWTKHVEFPGRLIEIRKDSYGGVSSSIVSPAVDVHRSMLDNEIVIESDYPTYEENYEAAILIGKILEDKGFIPHYYYSGGKSIHIHVYFSWYTLSLIDGGTQDQLRILFADSKLKFKRKFMQWLRHKMISCWDTHAKQFDEDLISANHRIRSELSRNSKGFKTFLGNSYQDLSFVPYICNEENRIYPKLGPILQSVPYNINVIIEEFINDIVTSQKRERIRRKNRSLSDWGLATEKDTVRECVKAILSDDFKKVGDGHKRAMFILLNELKQVFGSETAENIILDWNEKLGNPVDQKEIDYRLGTKIYSLPCGYIHKFLKELGLDVSKKCKDKIYK